MDGPHATAFAEASTFLADTVGAVPAGAWDGPGLGQWNLRELVGHANRSHTLLRQYLDHPRPPEPPDSPYFSPEAIAARGREAVAALGADPAGSVRRHGAMAVALVAATPLDAVVGSPLGRLTLAQYLPSRTAELTIHAIDVARAVGVDPLPPSSALVESLELVSRRSAARSGVDVLLALTGRGTLPAGYSVY